MSQMNELYEKVSQDTTLQEKFNKIMQDEEEAGEQKTGERLVAFAQEAGFSVNLEEIQGYFKDLVEKKDGQLSDVELDMVAGGKSTIGGLGIACTVVTVGIGCAAASLIEEANHADCGRMFR